MRIATLKVRIRELMPSQFRSADPPGPSDKTAYGNDRKHSNNNCLPATLALLAMNDSAVPTASIHAFGLAY
jgi:hypothetical protein